MQGRVLSECLSFHLNCPKAHVFPSKDRDIRSLCPYEDGIYIPDIGLQIEHILLL